MIAIEIAGHRFEITDGKWTGKPLGMARTFKVLLPILREKANIGYDPDPDKTDAELIIDYFNGKIVDISKHKPFDYGKEVVY